MKFTSKQVTTIVVAICLAAVLTPVAVYAATQVTIFDGEGDSARVSSDGALSVEERASVPAGAFSARGSRYQFGWIPLVSATGPNRIAITELTLSGGYDPVGGAGEVLLEAFVRTSGTAACTGPGAPGYRRTTLKHVWVPVRSTIQLTFDGVALRLPNADRGEPTCFGVTYYAGTTNLVIYADATGYKYVP
jgi:hypothetical protein